MENRNPAQRTRKEALWSWVVVSEAVNLEIAVWMPAAVREKERAIAGARSW